MEAEKQKSLEERNRRIIQAVIKKMEKTCPGSVALIGIGGSFYSGDIYEKSDLDLLIVTNDEKAKALSHGFILDGVGFDIYCSDWGRLEYMAEYNDPYGGKLFDLQIVYTYDKASEERYLHLRENLRKKLDAPLSAADVEKAHGFLRLTEQEYVNVMTAEEISACRYSAALMMYYLQFSIYMLNKQYIQYGVKRIPREISGMKRLPEGFVELQDKTVRAGNTSEVKCFCTKLLTATRKYFKNFEPAPKEKKELTAENLIGTYEEIYSNWRNKMYHSADINSPFLSFSTIASCQNFYTEMYDEYNMDYIDVMAHFDPSDLESTAEGFDRAMAEYLKWYGKLGVKVAAYEDIGAFERGYWG